MKSEVPLLGRPRALDYVSAEQSELAEEGRSVEEVARLLVGKLEGLPIWGHPRTQINVVPPSSIPSIIGSLLPAIYNPNLVSDDTSFGLALTEAAVAAMTARLVGLRHGEVGRCLHVRRDRHDALRRQARHRKGHARRDGQRRRAPTASFWRRRRATTAASTSPAGWASARRASSRCRRTCRTTFASTGSTRLPARRSTRAGASWRWSRRWGRPTRSASTTSTRSSICVTGWSTTTTSTTHRTSTPTPSSVGRGRSSTTMTSNGIRSDFVPARCGRSRWPAAASRSCTGPTQSGSISTRPASRPTSRASSWSATGPTCSSWCAAGTRCRICSSPANATPGCSRWRRRAAVQACSRRTPTCTSSAGPACACCSATSWRWPSRCASISKGTIR